MNFKVYLMVMALFGIGVAAVRYTAGPELRRIVDGRLYACYAGATLVGFVQHNVLIFMIVCAIVLVVAARNALDAICLYVLFVALSPSVIAVLSAGGMYFFRLSPIPVLAIAAMAAIAIKGERGRGAPLRGVTVEDCVVVLLFLTLTVGGNRFGDPLGLVRALVAQGLTMLLPYIFFRRHVRSAAELRVVIAVLGVAAGLLSLFAIYEAQTGWTMFSGMKSGLSDAGRAHGRSMRGGAVRAVATMAGPLSLACYLVFGWVAAAVSRPLFRTRLFWTGWLVLIAWGIFSTQSRGNLVALAAAIIVLLALNGRAVLAGTAAGLAIAGWIMLQAIASLSPALAALINPSGAEEGDDYDYRSMLLRRGLEEGAKHRWTGASMNSVLARLEDMRQGEGIIDLVNNYLTIYLVSGLLGLIPIVICLVWIVGKLLSAVAERAGPEVRAIRAFAIISVGLFIFQMSFTSFGDRATFLMGLAMATARASVILGKRERQQVARARAGSLALPIELPEPSSAALPQKAPQGG